MLSLEKGRVPEKNWKDRSGLTEYALADLGGGLRGLQPPLSSKNFTKKRSFLAIFRAATPPFPDRMVDKSSHERLQPPLSKISRSAHGMGDEFLIGMITFVHEGRLHP